MLPVLSELVFKALNFNSSTLTWITWPISSPECGGNYTIKLVEGGNTSSIVCYVATATTSLNVTGLTRGEEYTVTVSTAHSCKTILMTLEGI